MAEALETLLRIVHIGAAVAWVGGGTFWGVVVMPGLAQLGPTLPKGTLPTLGARVMKFLPAAGVLTLLGGLAMWYSMTGGRAGSDPWSMAIMVSLLLTLAMLGVLVGVTMPVFRKVVKALNAPGPPGPELAALRQRMMLSSMATLAMGWVTVVLMVVAVSVRTT